jgi:putative hydrolase of the HAD superfamily
LEPAPSAAHRGGSLDVGHGGHDCAVSVSLVIFDLDGTIVDHEGSVRAALANWLPTLDVAPDEELLAAWFAAEDRHFPAWRAREVSFQEQRRRRLRDFLPLIGRGCAADDELDLIFEGYLREYETAWTAFDDVAPALAAIAERRLRTAVLSNGTDAQQNAKIAAVGLRGRLGPVFTADGLGTAKPDPRTYLRVCERLDVPAREAVHVGDLYELDVLAPRRAGLLAIHLDRHDAGPAGEPWRMTSLAALPRLVDALSADPDSDDCR